MGQPISVLHSASSDVSSAPRWQCSRTNLPDELILTNYFTVRDGQIVTLIINRNTPASY
jgi:hypothetical protein